MAPKIKSTVVKTPQLPPKRRRTKKLHKDLLEQLEFYLSEANLRHDAFMRENAGERGMDEVPIQLLLSFPLIHEMKVNEKNMISAVENSRFLQLSDDRKHIRRRYPVPRPPHDLEQSTLYIENLPPDSTIEWLKEVCQKIGNVRYISLPRYKRSGTVKGFAFIEFSSPDDVTTACRIFKDPPKYFFPNRTKKYLKRLNRVRDREILTFKSPMSQKSAKMQANSHEVASNAESCFLNKSIDSAIDFELLGHEHGIAVTSTTRKRKRRRSRAISEVNASETSKMVEVSHVPAKKLKSLPVKDSTDILRGESEFDPISMTTKKKEQNVVFSFTDNEADKSIKTYDKQNNMPNAGCKNFGKNNDNTANLMNKIVEKTKNGDLQNLAQLIPSDTKIEIHDKTTGKLSALDRPETKNVFAGRPASDVESLVSLKRRRSISEPPELSEDSKKLKEELTHGSDAHVEQPIKSLTTLDIDKLISQGRQQAQATKKNVSFSDFSSKRYLQSVVAKATAQKTKKSRRRSRKSKEAKKTKTRQPPPKLTAMPKVQWSELKKEYKNLQKENMRKLKLTIRENKDAGSVFIKKHLDVLNDINVSNNSVTSDVSDEESAKFNSKNEAGMHMKRGPPTFQSGVIVRISAVESELSSTGDLRPLKLPNIEAIKSQLNRYGQGVAYVDVKPGECSGFVRFNDGDSAQRAILEEKGLALCLLTGDLEERYWDKLLASRAQKFAKERPKVRGRMKIIARAEILVEKAKRRHIRFDNDLTA